MSPRIKKILAFLASLILGGGLLYLSLYRVDFSEVFDALRTARYVWLLPLLVVALLSHLLRAVRWRLLLETLTTKQDQAPSISVGLAFSSVMIGYMVNYAAPRLGEFARAGNLSSQTALRFPSVFGTVVVERVLDVLTAGLALLTVVAIFGSRLWDVANVFMDNTKEVIGGLPATVWFVGIALALLALTVGIYWFVVRRKTRSAGEEKSLLGAFQDGLVSLLRVRQKGQLILTTLGIWFCYTLMADIPLRLFGYDGLYNLGLIDSWALMNIGTIGMALPAPGGTGSFHYVTIQTLTQLFNVPETPAAAYALFAHASQLVLFCVVGFLCLLHQGTSFQSIRKEAVEAQDAHES